MAWWTRSPWLPLTGQCRLRLPVSRTGFLHMGHGRPGGSNSADGASRRHLGDGHRCFHTHALLRRYTPLPPSSCSFFDYCRQCAHIPVTSRGSSILKTDTSNFILNNILVAPSLVHNLLSVRQFTHDNSCSIEIDASGFSVKEPRMGRVILRCDSTGDLYTIPSAALTPTQAHHAASASLWHRRLGHPSPAIIASLRRNNLISCNKPDQLLCHTCQLGKHVRLPFSTSLSKTVSPFAIVHYDVWTSTILSLSSYKYYLVLLDDFTHYCWTYPLKRSPRYINTLLILLLLLVLSSVFLLNAFRLIMARSLLITPCIVRLL
jgi:hypothetical protein